jgi:RNA polymerase subunit RPABC4/transcription elongation factor Spt4
MDGPMTSNEPDQSIVTVKPTPPSIRQSSEKHCHACAAVLHASANMCPHCGATQALTTPSGAQQNTSGLTSSSPDSVFCRGCGISIHKTANTCPKCGAQQTQSVASVVGNKDRTTAGLLAIFLGGVGVHKFYLGSILLGFCYLFFFWTGIPAIIGLIEGIYYFTLSEQEFARKYG